jgi:hypothetical protein
MAKRMYADVVMNGIQVNLSIRASSEKEARTKLETFPEYRGVSKILDISTDPPRKIDREENDRIPLWHRKKVRGYVKHYTGGHLHTY